MTAVTRDAALTVLGAALGAVVVAVVAVRRIERAINEVAGFDPDVLAVVEGHGVVTR